MYKMKKIDLIACLSSNETQKDCFDSSNYVLISGNKKGFQSLETLSCTVWELTGSNRRPSACKADALNQLS